MKTTVKQITKQVELSWDAQDAPEVLGRTYFFSALQSNRGGRVARVRAEITVTPLTEVDALFCNAVLADIWPVNADGVPMVTMSTEPDGLGRAQLGDEVFEAIQAELRRIGHELQAELA